MLGKKKKKLIHLKAVLNISISDCRMPEISLRRYTQLPSPCQVHSLTTVRNVNSLLKAYISSSERHIILCTYLLSHRRSKNYWFIYTAAWIQINMCLPTQVYSLARFAVLRKIIYTQSIKKECEASQDSVYHSFTSFIIIIIIFLSTIWYLSYISPWTPYSFSFFLLSGSFASSPHEKITKPLDMALLIYNGFLSRSSECTLTPWNTKTLLLKKN